MNPIITSVPEQTLARKVLGWVIDPQFSWKDITEKRRTQLLAVVTLVFGFLIIVGVLNTVSYSGWSLQSYTLLSLSLLTFISYGLSRTSYYYFGAWLFIGSLNVGAYLFAAADPENPAGTLNSLLVFVLITASVLFSVRSLAALTGINILIFFITNQIIPGLTTVQEFSIISISGSIAILNLFFSWYRNLVENQRISDIQAANVRLQDENKELGAKRSTLETLIEDRSKELNDANRQNEVRAAQFRAITEIARVINTRQNLQELLPKITNVISEQFGFYHVGIFLNDFSNQYAVLSAANSEGGKKMIERGHRLKVGDQGIIGYVTKAGVPRIALNTESDIIYFNNPDLPDTRSEIGLPLKSGDKVIGALDVQSTITDAFSGEDIDILTALSDQVSLSIENTRLFEQTQKALTEAEAISRQYLNQSWGTLKQEKSILGFRYSMGAVAPLNQEKEKAKNQAEENKAYINVPIQLRGITIGSLRVAMPQDKRARQNEKDLINAVAERVALSVENARLFEETNKRAERERIIAGIADKIGASFRTESVLATTAQELSQFLEGAEILIQLGTTPTKQ